MSAVNILVEETVETVTISVTNGADGEAGAAATVAVGATTTGEAGTNASVTETGTAQNKTFDFVIPRGADGAAGADGEAGAAAIVAVGATTTGEAGTNASVTETGDAQNKTFDFVIPRGADGAAGADGEAGAAATVAVGATTTGEAGTNASVTETGDAQNKTFDFLIPRGAVGAAATVAVGTTTTGEAGTNASVTETGDAQNKTFNFVIPRGADGGGGGGGKFVDGTNPDDAVYLAGRVGVGVALPVARQHIQGNDAAVVVQRVQGAGGQTANLAEWHGSGGQLLVEISNNGEASFSKSGSTMVVGGLNYQTYYLQIRKGLNYAVRWGLQASNNISSLGTALMQSTKTIAFIARTNGNTEFDSETTPHLIIHQDGDVGINVKVPQAKLDIAGSVASKVVQITQGAAGQTANLAEWRNAGGVLIAAITPTGKIKASSINFTGLPTSAAGLETGDVWNDNGALKIV
jgi:hypothetical protein